MKELRHSFPPHWIHAKTEPPSGCNASVMCVLGKLQIPNYFLLWISLHPLTLGLCICWKPNHRPWCWNALNEMAHKNIWIETKCFGYAWAHMNSYTQFSWQFDREAPSHSGSRVHSTFKFLLVRDCLVTTHWTYAVDQVYKIKPERVWTEEKC
jgi:hypothetical protein